MGERDRLSRADIEAGAIQGDEMNEQLATIKRVADTLIATRDKEIDRLRSENSELRAALLELMFAEKLDDDNPRLLEARKQARAILERTKK